MSFHSCVSLTDGPHGKYDGNPNNPHGKSCPNSPFEGKDMENPMGNANNPMENHGQTGKKPWIFIGYGLKEGGLQERKSRVSVCQYQDVIRIFSHKMSYLVGDFSWKQPWINQISQANGNSKALEVARRTCCLSVLPPFQSN